MMEVDATHITVPMSRWPIVIQSHSSTALNPPSRNQLSMSHLSLNSSKSKSQLDSLPSSSTIRRKPKITYRAPEADAPLRIEGPVKDRKLNASNSVLSPREISASTSKDLAYFVAPLPVKKIAPKADRATSPVFSPAPPLFRLQSSLPSYHPLSFRSTSSFLNYRQKENSAKAASTPVTVEDEDKRVRRSSSRTRKPAAKLREADASDNAEANEANENGEMGNGKKESPKRKRANAAAGPRKRKREPAAVVERDTPYPKRKSRATRMAEAAAEQVDENEGGAAEGALKKASEDNDAMEAVAGGTPMDIDTNTPGADDTPSPGKMIPSESTAKPQAPEDLLETASQANADVSPRKSRRAAVATQKSRFTRRNSAASITTNQTEGLNDSRLSITPPAPSTSRRGSAKKAAQVSTKDDAKSSDTSNLEDKEALEPVPEDSVSESTSRTSTQQSGRSQRKSQKSSAAETRDATPTSLAALIDDPSEPPENIKAPRKANGRKRGNSGNSLSTAPRNKSRARARANRQDLGAYEGAEANDAGVNSNSPLGEVNSLNEGGVSSQRALISTA